MPLEFALLRCFPRVPVDQFVRWHMQTSGPRQAAAYELDLIARCREISDGTVQTQDCPKLIDPGLPERFRFARAGQHFIVFIADDMQVVIVDFLHARADLPRRLAGLAPDKES